MSFIGFILNQFEYVILAHVLVFRYQMIRRLSRRCNFRLQKMLCWVRRGDGIWWMALGLCCRCLVVGDLTWPCALLRHDDGDRLSCWRLEEPVDFVDSSQDYSIERLPSADLFEARPFDWNTLCLEIHNWSVFLEVSWCTRKCFLLLEHGLLVTLLELRVVSTLFGSSMED